jgi:hypothetical protein
LAQHYTPRPAPASTAPIPRPRPTSSPTSAPPASGPSAWRQQHGQVETPQIDGRAFRPYWRARPQIDKLLNSGAITAQEWQRAQEFRALYERAHQGELAALAPDRVYLDSNCRHPGSGEPSRSRIAALERLARVRGELGEVVYGLMIMVAVHDASWAQIGRRLRADPKTARSWAIVALQALAAMISDTRNRRIGASA